MDQVVCSYDGACEPYNPGGDMGLGWVIGEQSHHRYIPANPDNSNNVAEYMALLALLTALDEKQPRKVTITGDSQLVAHQLDGTFAVRSRNILPHFEAAKNKLTELRLAGFTITIRWVPRDKNEEADAASKRALTEAGIAPVQREPSPGFSNRLVDIAEPLCISAIALGKLMTMSGLRDGKTPSEGALSAGIAQQRFDGYGISVDWYIEGVTRYLRDKCLQDLSAATQAGLEKKLRKSNKENLEAKEKAEIEGETERIKKLGRFVRNRIEAGAALIEAVEEVVDAQEDRPAVYRERLGFWRNRNISGLSPLSEIDRAVMESFEQRCSNEVARLDRRAAHL